jgi:hypothetical protein
VQSNPELAKRYPWVCCQQSHTSSLILLCQPT